MKIAITGHTRGIGKAIADMFIEMGHTVIGLSSSNGFDLTNEAQRKAAFNTILDCDMFVNNAIPCAWTPENHMIYVPVEFLYNVHKRWKGKDNKVIINIGSDISNLGLMNTANSYQVSKIALENAHKQLAYSSRQPKMILVKPGATDTDQIRHRPEVKMQPEDVANVIKFCVESLDTVYIREITVAPGKKYFDAYVPTATPAAPSSAIKSV